MVGDPCLGGFGDLAEVTGGEQTGLGSGAGLPLSPVLSSGRPPFPLSTL